MSDTSVFAQANLAHGETEGHAPAWHGASADPAGHRNPAALTGFKPGSSADRASANWSSMIPTTN
ncbi:hypothetical protein [Variovorax sp. PAMC 28711]|uniref:hypothetical protein n=1 Tax=Variovorax sp. PAMC 28711 TaxID=1795631 RepID=UPI0014395B79|nr:hypothetical protein [Variovorax sp. PAMC 28711]